MKRQIYIYLLITFCFTSKAQNSYLPIDTVVENDQIDLNYNDSIIRYYFSDSIVYIIEVFYKSDDPLYKSQRNISLDSGMIKTNTKTEIWYKKRLVKRHKTTYGRVWNLEYNLYRKYKRIDYRDLKGKHEVTNTGWQRTQYYKPRPYGGKF